MTDAITLLQAGLKTETLRESVLSYELANINTHPSTHHKILFESLLNNEKTIPHSKIIEEQGSLSLDTLMLNGLATQHRTQALLKGLNMMLSELNLAISGGLE